MIGVLIASALIAPPWIPGSEIPVSTQKQVLNATVRLVNPHHNNGQGTAVRIGYDRHRAFYLTAAHNVQEAKNVQLQSFSANSYPKATGAPFLANVAFKVTDTDLALLWAPSEHYEPYLNICAQMQRPKLGVNGLSVIMVGCQNGRLPEVSLPAISAEKLLRKPDGARGWYWEALESPTEGCSGGPVADSSGQLIGIVSGTSDGKGYYVHIREIEQFLSDQPFAALKPATKTRNR